MARTEHDMVAGGEDQAPVGRHAPSARDAMRSGRGEEGSAVPGPGAATVGAEPAARSYRPDGEDEIADAASGPGVLLIDPARLARELGRNGFLGDPDEKAEATSPEDEQRRGYLRRYAHAPGGLFRRHLVADADVIRRLDALGAEAPNAAVVVDVVKRAALLSLHAGSPLRLPPLLLVGPPGTGKSRIARRIAEALGTTLTTIDGGSTTDRGPIVGHDPGYRGSSPGKIATSLLDGPTAGPMVLLDEVDKVSAYSYAVRPLDALLSLLESSTADAFVDTYIGLPMRAGGVSWILTTNSAAGLPAPLLDRVITVEVPPLGRAETREAVRRVFHELLAEHGLPAAELGDAALRRLERSGLRQARRTLLLTLGPALAAGRGAPDAAAVAEAIALVGRPAPQLRRPARRPPARPPVGFVHFSVAPSGAGEGGMRDVARTAAVDDRRGAQADGGDGGRRGRVSGVWRAEEAPIGVDGRGC